MDEDAMDAATVMETSATTNPSIQAPETTLEDDSTATKSVDNSIISMENTTVGTELVTANIEGAVSIPSTTTTTPIADHINQSQNESVIIGPVMPEQELSQNENNSVIIGPVKPELELAREEEDSIIIGPVLPQHMDMASCKEDEPSEKSEECVDNIAVDIGENQTQDVVGMENGSMNVEEHAGGAGDAEAIQDFESEEMGQAWTIDYDFTKPELIVKESEEFSHRDNNYLKGCKWSPDGSCLLTCSEDNKLRLFNLPHSLWQKDFTGVEKLDLALTMAEGGLIYDYCWYPSMTSQNADSCVLACTGRGLPVHLWDAFSGQIRCSYRPYDHVDEMISAKTIAFDRTGEKIYCGFEKQIRVFDTSRPGRECQMYNYKSTKKRQVRGQSGIMSSFSFHYDNTMFAVGTYGRTVGLYSTESNKCVQILRGHATGVTQVQFLPNGNHLLSGTRKDNDIFCWDIRYHRAPVSRVQRLVKTNQRMLFSIDSSGRYLASGNHDGKLSIWDLHGSPMDDTDILPPVCEFSGHEDTANGVDFHPFLPILASSSGQHHSQSPFAMGSDGDSESDSENENEIDNSLKLWWIGSKTNSEMTENVEAI